jgi:hypothetical protein
MFEVIQLIRTHAAIEHALAGNHELPDFVTQCHAVDLILREPSGT